MIQKSDKSKYMKMSVRILWLLLMIASLLIPAKMIAEAAALPKDYTRCEAFHIVQKGDWLWWIAKQYGISTTEIIKANNLNNSHGIRPGDFLCIPRVSYDVKYPYSELHARLFAKRYIRICGANFIKNTRWFVRARQNRQAGWKKIGAVRSDYAGSFYANLKLPKSMADAHTLEICLKEITKGYKVCTTIRR